MKLVKPVCFVKNRTKQDIARMEDEFTYCQEHLNELKCWQHLYELMFEAIRICITKRTKETDVYLWSWQDRISDGAYEYMNRYRKNPNYRSPYLFKAASWIMLKILYDPKFIEKYEDKIKEDPMLNYEELENYTELSYDSFEDELIERISNEQYDKQN